MANDAPSGESKKTNSEKRPETRRGREGWRKKLSKEWGYCPLAAPVRTLSATTGH